MAIPADILSRIRLGETDLWFHVKLGGETDNQERLADQRVHAFPGGFSYCGAAFVSECTPIASYLELAALAAFVKHLPICETCLECARKQHGQR